MPAHDPARRPGRPGRAPERARGRARPRRRPLEPARRGGAAARRAPVQRAGRGRRGHRAQHPRPTGCGGWSATGSCVATPYSRRPPRMEYALTADGRELAGALHLLAEWGSRRGGVGEPLRHELCGTPLQAAWHCPTCERLVADDEPDGLTRSRRLDRERVEGLRRARPRRRRPRPGDADPQRLVDHGCATRAPRGSASVSVGGRERARGRARRRLRPGTSGGPGVRAARPPRRRAARVAADDRLRRLRPAAEDHVHVPGIGQERRHERMPGRRPALGQRRLHERQRVVRAAAPAGGRPRPRRAPAHRARPRSSPAGRTRRWPTAAGRRAARARRRAAAWRARGPERVAGSDGTPAARSGATSSGPAGTSTRVPARGQQAVGEHVVGDRPVGVHAARDDLADRVGDTTSIRSNAATTAWSGAASGWASVISRTYPRRRAPSLVDEPAQDRERALGTGGDGRALRVVGVEAAAGRRRRVPRLDRPAGPARGARPARGWAARPPGSAPTPASMARRASSSASTIAGDASDSPIHGRRRVAEHGEELPPRRPVGVDALQRRAREGRRRWRRRSPAGRARRAAPPRGRGRRCRPRPRWPAPAAAGRTRPWPWRTAGPRRRRAGAGPGPR